ncbi:hypothetical protein B0H17DRAFT_1110653 [Mycena rosella]|uniref:Uncharacterized protein n=1 Tax=Mycena rosella TaxID=1033263 RepID=A0AAD7BNW1_MYCRO|nr:hypothetical protein B0H17DRAFT_1110653 [Mycena rosella]
MPPPQMVTPKLLPAQRRDVSPPRPAPPQGREAFVHGMGEYLCISAQRGVTHPRLL